MLIDAYCAENIDDARLEAELLYAFAVGVDRVNVIANGNSNPKDSDINNFESLLDRRLNHEPLAYILGHKEFYSLDFLIGPGALIPRPETEAIVDVVLRTINEHPPFNREVIVADVGTGSGAIAVAIGIHAPHAKIFAIDKSKEALVWAGKNIAKHKLEKQITLLQGDLLQPLKRPIDIIIANLPYIPADELQSLPKEISKHEPYIAVNGGEDGLELYRNFSKQLPEYLSKKNNSIIVEVGAGQMIFVQEILLDNMPNYKNTQVEIHRDLRNIRRVLEIRNSN
tara:strand:- start:1566 stop:2414 length:849 start_codon:yes stop_codon:yes gene_type:complete